ncbi:MAG: hypothetical protein J6Y72_01400 [Bacteroidales bacterium]|nr:hypothetical protein [Bacteroidales bacterium]
MAKRIKESAERINSQTNVALSLKPADKNYPLVYSEDAWDIVKKNQDDNTPSRLCQLLGEEGSYTQHEINEALASMGGGNGASLTDDDGNPITLPTDFDSLITWLREHRNGLLQQEFDELFSIEESCEDSTFYVDEADGTKMTVTVKTYFGKGNERELVRCELTQAQINKGWKYGATDGVYTRSIPVNDSKVTQGTIEAEKFTFKMSVAGNKYNGLTTSKSMKQSYSIKALYPAFYGFVSLPIDNKKDLSKFSESFNEETYHKRIIAGSQADNGMDFPTIIAPKENVTDKAYAQYFYILTKGSVKTALQSGNQEIFKQTKSENEKHKNDAAYMSQISEALKTLNHGLLNSLSGYNLYISDLSFTKENPVNTRIFVNI